MRLSGAELKDYQLPIKFGVSNIENVDGSVYDYIKRLKIHATGPNGLEEAKLTWVSPERSLASKKERYFRDHTGALILPIIAIERTSIVKDPSKKGTAWGNIVPHDDEKGGSIRIARRLKQDKTSNFVNSETKRRIGKINFPGLYSERIIYETISIPMPVYVECTYRITIRTEYQQQMNEILTPFITKPGGVNYILLPKNGHRYEGFIQQDFSQNNNYTSYTSEERKVETTLDIRVLAYLIGEDKNQQGPLYSIRENAVDIKLPRERLIFGDVPEHEDGKFYGLAGVAQLAPTGEPDRQITPFVYDRSPEYRAQAVGGGGGGSVAGAVTTTNYVPNQLFNQVPNGSRTTFTIPEPFVIGSQMVFRDGVLMKPGDEPGDFDYSVPNNTTIEFDPEDPPTSEENLMISYVKA